MCAVVRAPQQRRLASREVGERSRRLTRGAPCGRETEELCGAHRLAEERSLTRQLGQEGRGEPRARARASLAVAVVAPSSTSATPRCSEGIGQPGHEASSTAPSWPRPHGLCSRRRCARMIGSRSGSLVVCSPRQFKQVQRCGCAPDPAIAHDPLLRRALPLDAALSRDVVQPTLGGTATRRTPSSRRCRRRAAY